MDQPQNNGANSGTLNLETHLDSPNNISRPYKIQKIQIQPHNQFGLHTSYQQTLQFEEGTSNP
jgi:hypothetical protein